MEQVLDKLSEIETTANHIMEEAAKAKQALSLEAAEQRRQFDAQVDAETEKKVAEIRRQLEKDKEKELAKLQERTGEFFADMDVYYEKNHCQLVQQLYDQILKG